MKVLVTGGAGYIGSHTCVELLTSGHDVVVVDNLDNSSEVAIERIQEITEKPISFYQLDIRNTRGIGLYICKEKVDAVIHFAGLKAVGESVQKPNWVL